MSAKHPSHGGSELAATVREAYLAGQTDYSLDPIILADAGGNPIGRIQDGDAVIFCLRRGEREIQLTEAFVDYKRDYFPRKKFSHLPFVILTLYHEKFKGLPVAFAPSRIPDALNAVLGRTGRSQLHISESEKFSHVTFFFNGGNNQAFHGETDICIPSPKGIPFDQIPELSLEELTAQLIQSLNYGYEFILTNIANGDVIGHTSNNEAKIHCAEIIDKSLSQLVPAALAAKYLVMITADHGNLEEMITPEGKPHVSHTANPVPFLISSPEEIKNFSLRHGTLADIAPTILHTLGIPQPHSMTGSSLILSESALTSRRVLLIILDGWGIGKNDETNPIFMAHTPFWDKLINKNPFTTLAASGEAVGLQDGKSGNSEAGHINIGTGRLVLQDDVRLESALQDGSFFSNEIFLQTLEDVKKRNSKLHLIGLLSEKSSHGSIDYPLALLQMAKDHGIEDVYIHLIFDGRSTQPGSAPDMLLKLDQQVIEIGIGEIVTGIGRGIALDRNGDYQKTKCAYDALVFGIGKFTNKP